MHIVWDKRLPRPNYSPNRCKKRHMILGATVHIGTSPRPHSRSGHSFSLQLLLCKVLLLSLVLLALAIFGQFASAWTTHCVLDLSPWGRAQSSWGRNRHANAAGCAGTSPACAAIGSSRPPQMRPSQSSFKSMSKPDKHIPYIIGLKISLSRPQRCPTDRFQNEPRTFTKTNQTIIVAWVS